MKRRFYKPSPVLIVIISFLLSAWSISPLATYTSLFSSSFEPVVKASPTPRPIITPLPNKTPKPEVLHTKFGTCDADGHGTLAAGQQDNTVDDQQNILKNRTDEPKAYDLVTFQALLALGWPKGSNPTTNIAYVERRERANWAASDAAQIAKYEGIPVSAEGYIFLKIDSEGNADGAEQGPAETANCLGTKASEKDWHIWFTETSAAKDRTKSIVIETTPRVRAKHDKWTLALMRQIAREQRRVRISGWLFFDPEHPEQLGKTRATLWEIHPIMNIEVYWEDKNKPSDSERLYPLDNCIVVNPPGDATPKELYCTTPSN